MFESATVCPLVAGQRLAEGRPDAETPVFDATGAAVVEP